MGELSYSSTIFKNVKKWEAEYDGTVSYTGILLSSKLNQKNGQDYKLIDAVDIDWDGAYVSSLGIILNNTEDLINALNALNPKNLFNDLSENVTTLLDIVNGINSAYVSNSYLGEILLSYQNKLVAGDYITISDETNVITTYDLISYGYLGEVLTSYTTNDDFNNFKSIVVSNYYTKTETEEVATEIAEDAVKRVIDNADEAFDTLKEISDWILEQRRYEPISYDEMVKDGSVTYYILDAESGKYIAVDTDYITNNPDAQYYVLNDTATDVSKLFKTVNDIQTTIGTYTVNDAGFVTYTGMLLDINTNKNEISEINTRISSIASTALDAKDIANKSYDIAYEAIVVAYSAYDLTSYSIDLAEYSYEVARDSYNMAYSAYTAVGHPSKKQGFREITAEEKQSIIDGNLSVTTYILNNTGAYVVRTVTESSTDKFYIYEPYVSATGIYYRVESVEGRLDDAENEINNAKDIAIKSLYNLSADNSNSPYVQLGLSPAVFNGSPDRVINITTTDAEFNSLTGEIIQDGIPTIMTIKDCFSYLTSWQILTTNYQTTT